MVCSFSCVVVWFIFLSGWVGVVVYDEHTNIQCISFLVLFSGSIPCTLVGTSNLPDNYSPMECKHSNHPRYHNRNLQNNFFYCY